MLVGIKFIGDFFIVSRTNLCRNW